MNHLLAAIIENAEKHCLLVCIFCKKAFSNHQALFSHLKAHQEATRSGIKQNHPDNSSTSIDINASNYPTDNPSGGSENNMSTIFNGVSLSSPFSDSFCSNQSLHLIASSFSENNLRNINSQFIVSPNLSSGYGNVEFTYPQRLPSTLISSFGSNPAAGFPVDSSYLVPNETFQYNTGECQSYLGGISFSSADALQNFQYPNLSNLPSPPPLTVEYLYPAVGSDQPSFFKEPTACVLLPLNLCPSPGLDEVDQHNKKNTMKSQRGKRPYSGDVPVNAEIAVVTKRPKIASKPRVRKGKARKKELSLFKDLKNPTPSIASSSVVGKEESEADLDLSLHL